MKDETQERLIHLDMTIEEAVYVSNALARYTQRNQRAPFFDGLRNVRQRINALVNDVI